MREAHVGDVLGQLHGQLLVGQAGPPRAEVHLVHAHRLAYRLPPGASGRPLLVAPGVLGGEHHRRGGGRPLGQVGQRVGLVPPHAVLAVDRVLVPGALGHAGHEQLPHARSAERAHREPAAVPEVEVAGDAHPAGVRRPHRERRPGHRAGLADVRAEHLPQLLVPAFPDQVQVEIADHGQEPVRVVGHLLVAAVRVVRGGDPVVRHLLVRQGDREHALGQVGHGHPAAVVEHQGHRRGQRPQGPDDDAVRAGMGAQDRMRIVVLPGDQPFDLGQADLAVCHGPSRLHFGD